MAVHEGPSVTSCSIGWEWQWQCHDSDNDNVENDSDIDSDNAEDDSDSDNDNVEDDSDSDNDNIEDDSDSDNDNVENDHFMCIVEDDSDSDNDNVIAAIIASLVVVVIVVDFAHDKINKHNRHLYKSMNFNLHQHNIQSTWTHIMHVLLFAYFVFGSVSSVTSTMTM